MIVALVFVAIGAALIPATFQDEAVANDCSSPPDTGNCRAYLKRWNYDAESNSCKEFVYGGCPSNNGGANRFIDEQRCKQACWECPIKCRQNLYEPVCGSNGKTYTNKCELQMAAQCSGENVQISYLKRCKVEPACPLVCPNLYEPVCGSNGITYSNECELNMAGCNGENVVVISKSSCENAAVPK